MPKALLNVSGMHDEEPYAYNAGDDVPADVAKSISNPYVFEKTAKDVESDPEAPPVTGQGSGEKAWREYAERVGIDTEGKDKDTLVAEARSRNLMG